jgi:hypothetical protein
MSADVSVTGEVHVIEDTKSFGQKGFRKRTVVLEQKNGKFTNYLPLEFISDACDEVDALTVGDKVRIYYRLTGRKWQRDPSSEVKYFLSAEATRFEMLDGASRETASPQRPAPDDFIESDDSAPF